MPPKRKRSSLTAIAPSETKIPVPPPSGKRQPSRRSKIDTDPNHNLEILDGKAALRASPDADEEGEALDTEKIINGTTPRINSISKKDDDDETPICSPIKKRKKTPKKSSLAAKKGSDEIKAFKASQAAKKATETRSKARDEGGDEWDKRVDLDGDEAGPVEEIDILKKEAARPPPVNSGILPLPWKGRLGYACLNTYLRTSVPPIFTSRTCRIQSILDHRHPLQDPSLPEHLTKNRPDKTQPASLSLGQKYVESLGLANVRDIPKMLRWNDKYGIKFMRLSSEMFPFASHAEYGYKISPFASETLAEAGKVIMELGHRVSTHPGQFTQLGSPRKEVIESSVRDLEYHDEMLSLLRLGEQEDRDAVMILHMGGTFGDKDATIERFRDNYKALGEGVKRRLVLENDDVSWSVHDLLPVCEELNIPLCLDFHHHNIIFSEEEGVREGTKDIIALFPRIKKGWDRKRIKQKMHYSEPCPEAITGRQRRKHNPRPAALPPCPEDIDLMIEAKDKEQAVFELMRTYKLPGWDTFNNIIPYERTDDNRPGVKKAKTKKTKKEVKREFEEFGEELEESDEELKEEVPEEEVGMGGKENRVYWPPGMEEWLRPKKREVVAKKKDGSGDGGEGEEEMLKNPTLANFEARKAIEARNKELLSEDIKERLKDVESVGDVKRILDEVKAGKGGTTDKKVKSTLTKGKSTPKMKKTEKSVHTPSFLNLEDEDEEEDLSMPSLSANQDDLSGNNKVPTTTPSRQSIRARGKRMSYAEDMVDEDF